MVHAILFSVFYSFVVLHYQGFMKSKLIVTNCSFSGNSGEALHCNTAANVSNCIFWGNTDFVYNATVAIENCIVQGGYSQCIDCPGGDGNVDPLFVDLANGDLHLQPCSPAINAGTNTGAPATDLDGNARPYNPYSFGTAIVDMGAYEYSLPVDYCNTCEVAAVAGTLAMSPNSANICEGSNVSATFTPGSGGNGVDSLAYRTKTGSSTWSAWANYTSGANISTTGKTAVEIHTLRKANHCDYSDLVTVSWIVEQTPVSGTFDKTPDAAYVCLGSEVSASLTSGSGGNGSDEIDFRTYDGTAWSDWEEYTSGTGISTTGTTEVEIRTRRMSNHCDPSAYETISWFTQEPPVAYAGQDASILPGGSYSLTDATAEGFSSILWETNGDGNFDDVSAQNPTYSPGPNDKLAGSVALNISLEGLNSCGFTDNDQMILTIYRPPVVEITYPLEGDILYNNPVSATGTTIDPDGDILVVYLNVNYGGWELATGTNGWTKDLVLSAGENFIQAKAVDNQGLESNVAEVNVTLSVQVISIPQGWSAISAYLTPNDPDLDVVMQDLSIPGNLTIMLGKSGIFWPEYGTNSIGNWNVKEGYKVKYKNAVELTIHGSKLNDNSVTFGAGFQIIPVLSNVPAPIAQIFSNPVNDIKYMFDIFTGQIYWPMGGINTLSVLEPGKGYVANFTKTVTLTYPAYSGLKSGIMSNNTEPEMNSPWPLVRTADVHFVSIKSEAVNNLENVDFIGAFNSFGSCIGYTEIDGKSGNYLLTIFGDDETTDFKDGGEASEPISFKGFNSATNQDIELVAEFNTGFPNADGLFYSYGQSEIIGFKESATGIGETGFSGNIQVYPNPAKDEVNITLKGFRTLQGFGTLITADGKTVKTFTISGSETQIDVTNLNPGLYVLKIELEESITVKRVIIE